MKKSDFRRAMVLFKDEKAGLIEEIKGGYRFTYDAEFIKKNRPISVSLSTKQKIHKEVSLFPFFVGLLPEGWYLDMVSKKLKLDKKDAFGLLLATCKETIGAVTIKEWK